MPFISSSCLIAVARPPSTMLNERGESRHRYLIPDIKENTFSFSLLSMMLALNLSYMAFIILGYGSSIPTLVKNFIISRCWILSNAFPPFIRMILILYVVYHIN